MMRCFKKGTKRYVCMSKPDEIEYLCNAFESRTVQQFILNFYFHRNFLADYAVHNGNESPFKNKF